MLILVNKFIQITDMKFNRLDPTTGKNADDMKLIYSNQVLLLHKKTNHDLYSQKEEQVFFGELQEIRKNPEDIDMKVHRNRGTVKVGKWSLMIHYLRFSKIKMNLKYK